jgi:hypothetical protein
MVIKVETKKRTSFELLTVQYIATTHPSIQIKSVTISLEDLVTTAFPQYADVPAISLFLNGFISTYNFNLVPATRASVSSSFSKNVVEGIDSDVEVYHFAMLIVSYAEFDQGIIYIDDYRSTALPKGPYQHNFYSAPDSCLKPLYGIVGFDANSPQTTPYIDFSIKSGPDCPQEYPILEMTISTKLEVSFKSESY